MTLGTVLCVVSEIAPAVAAIASWCTVVHLARSWRSGQAANTYNRLVREPMRIANARFDEGIRALARKSATDEELASVLRQLSGGYMAAVRPLRSAQAIDLSTVVEGLEKELEKCEDDLTRHFAGNYSSPLAAGQLDSILGNHATSLVDLIECCDPGKVRSARWRWWPFRSRARGNRTLGPRGG